MTNTKLTALRAALENNTTLSEEARDLILCIVDDCHDCYGNEYDARDVLAALEDGEFLAGYFGLNLDDDEAEEQRRIAIVCEAYGFVDELAY